MKRILLATVLCTAMAIGSAQGRFAGDSVQIPVDRVVKNVEAWIKEKPQDAQGYYVLGRIHSMAWAYGPELSLWKSIRRAPADGGEAGGGTQNADPFTGELPGFAPYETIMVRPRNPEMKEVSAADADHLAQSIANYQKAVELDPKNALYELGLAWILQETGTAAANLPAGFVKPGADKLPEAERAKIDAAIAKLGNADAKVRDEGSRALQNLTPQAYTLVRQTKSADAEVQTRLAALLRGYWDLQALEHYRKAYAIDLDKDLKRPGEGPHANSMISAEAATSLLAILKEYPQVAKPDEVKEVTANFSSMKTGKLAMTPVIFAMPRPGKTAANVAELETPTARVSFDLAGDGLSRQWPWLTPGTALLVWDPHTTGQITSGKALFGSRTWWICFRDGYEALSVLDDNRDGQLIGPELDGIRVWIDRNGDGISQPGEVISLADVGIRAIGVCAGAGTDGVLSVEKGIVFQNGDAARTFDWITSPAEPLSQSQAHRGQ